MAYVTDLKKDEEKNQGANLTGTQTSGETSVINTGGDSAGPTGGQMQSNEPKQSRGGSSGWTNLQTYKDANVNNDASMASAIGKTQRKEKSDVAGAFGTLQSDLGKGIDDSSIKNFDTMTQRISQNPSDVSQDEFSKYYNYEYGGPQSLEEVGSFQGAQKELGDLSRISDQTKEYRGVADLLNQTYGQDANYNRGQNLLDAFITQSGDRGQRALGNIRSDFARTQEQYGEKQDLLGQQIDAARNYANQQGQDFRGQTESQYDQWLGDLAGAREGLEGSLSSGFGTTGAGLEGSIFGRDELMDYASQGADVNAKLAALSGLMGNQYESTDFNALADQLLAQEQEYISAQVQAEQQRQAQIAAEKEAARQEALRQQAQTQATGSTDVAIGDINQKLDPNISAGDFLEQDPWARDDQILGEDLAEKAKEADPVRKIISGDWSF